MKGGRQLSRSTAKVQKQKSILPGFGLTMGITITLLCLIVLIPLASLIIYTCKLSWGEFWGVISDARVLSSYRVSLLTSLYAALINTVMGLILAWTLTRYDFPGKKFLDGIIELPFALPTAVAGITLTHLTVKEGWVGRLFWKAGIEVAYTQFGITLALVFVGIPFVVRSVQPVLEKLDRQYEEAADILGASRSRTFFQVILPELFPSLFGGFTMAFARGLGEYGSVVFIAGNTPFKTEIAPLLIMSKLQSFDYPSATAIALVMLIFAFIILLINAAVQNHASKIVRGRS